MAEYAERGPTDAPAKRRRPSAKAGYHHGDLRAHLIAAVGELVESHGPEGFSIAEAARRAGVSTAAPYKHFADRDEILRAVAASAMDQLRRDMAAAAAAHPPGSLEAVAAIGQAYVAFARAQPGAFRLAFGLTEGHEADPLLRETGECCYAVVEEAVSAYAGHPVGSDAVRRASYFLWCFVHGHSFLTIDRKNEDAVKPEEDWDILLTVARGVLGPEPGRGGAR